MVTDGVSEWEEKNSGNTVSQKNFIAVENSVKNLRESCHPVFEKQNKKAHVK